LNARDLAHGVRTVIDLRHKDERGGDAARRPAEISAVHVALDGREHREFWDVWERLRARYAARREADQGPLLDMRAGGLGDAQLTAVRDRLLAAP
jgi:hypothetical protein